MHTYVRAYNILCEHCGVNASYVRRIKRFPAKTFTTVHVRMLRVRVPRHLYCLLYDCVLSPFNANSVSSAIRTCTELT